MPQKRRPRGRGVRKMCADPDNNKTWTIVPPPYTGPDWIGQAITRPPLEVGPDWIGVRISPTED